MKRELLMFVPGLSATQAGTYTERLLENLSDYAEKKMSAASFSRAGPDSNIWHYTPAGDAEPTREYVFQELVWADIPERLSAASGWRKFVGGLFLLGYTFPLLTTGILWRNTFQVVSVAGSTIILVLWYIGVIFAVPGLIAAIYTGPDWRFGEILAAITAAAAAPAWLTASALMALLPVNRFVDSAGMMKQYLVNESNVAEKAQRRVRAPIADIRRQVRKAELQVADPAAAQPGDAKPYDLVTVLAYSFGAVPAIEVLVDFYGATAPDVPVRLVTLGVPLPLAMAKRPQVADAAQLLAGSDVILTRWDFLWSPSDWLSADPATTGLAGKPRFASRTVTLPYDKDPTVHHGGYFEADQVAAILLETAES